MSIRAASLSTTSAGECTDLAMFSDQISSSQKSVKIPGKRSAAAAMTIAAMMMIVVLFDIH